MGNIRVGPRDEGPPFSCEGEGCDGAPAPSPAVVMAHDNGGGRSGREEGVWLRRSSWVRPFSIAFGL